MNVLTAGFLVADVIAADLPKISDPGELTFAPRGIRLAIGGHPANVSVDLLQLGMSRGEVGLVGAVGQDMFGDFIERELQRSGVLTDLIRVPGVGTTSDAILVVKGEDRRFHVDLGASWHFEPDRLLEAVREERPKLLYVATGICGKLDERLADVLAEGKRLGCATFVDLVTPFGKGWDFIHEPLKWTDVLHCNEFEAAKITGARDPKLARRAIIDMGVRLLFVTAGSAGATAYDHRGTSIEQPPFSVQAVDPTGAGDAFCAGVTLELFHGHLLDRLREGLDARGLRRLLTVGQAAGAICTTGVGATTAVTKENLERLLSEQGDKVEESTKATGGELA